MRLSFKFLIIVTSLFSGTISSQEVNERWIIKTESDITEILKSREAVKNIEIIFKDLNLFLIETHDAISQRDLTKNLLKNNDYIEVYPDINIELRRTPNDPEYPSQWGLSQIGMENVWDITTGGQAPNGEDIVVAIFDDGYDITHSDYVNNIWINSGEIQDNGIDDDNNGYIDDYLGWNATTNNDEHRLRGHGTAVAGIIGAVGNNGNLVAGVNWNVKLMLTSGGRNDQFSIADIVKAYDYIYTQRKLYNESNGANGAYVVASNYSGGAPNLFPEDFPSWCTIYDLLGEQGVINFTSAPNSNVDVDVVGDLPSTCTSDYLVIVTNSDQQDNKSEFAGFGAVSVDIAAPGEQIVTTGINSQVDPDFSGASASAPFVAGAVSLIYSVMCEEAYELSLQDPESLALMMRRILLQNVVPSASLEGITTSGGRLDVFSSLNAFRAEKDLGDCCTINISELNIKDESCMNASDGSVNVQLDTTDIRGTLNYNISSTEISNSNKEGEFNFLGATTYDLIVVADRDQACRADTSFLISPSIENCSFSSFEITKIGPNPNQGEGLKVWYQLDEAKDIEMVIYNSLGQRVSSKYISSNGSGNGSETLNIDHLSIGQYYVAIKANDKIDTQPFVLYR